MHSQNKTPPPLKFNLCMLPWGEMYIVSPPGGREMMFVQGLKQLFLTCIHIVCALIWKSRSNL